MAIMDDFCAGRAKCVREPEPGEKVAPEMSALGKNLSTGSIKHNRDDSVASILMLVVVDAACYVAYFWTVQPTLVALDGYVVSSRNDGTRGTMNVMILSFSL